MNEESLYSIPFDEKFVKAITSSDEKEWYKYRLGVDSPTLGEILDMPGARTGRFDRASQERVTLFKLYQEHLSKQNEKRGDAIDFRPGSQMPTPAQPSQAASPFGPQFDMPNPGITAPNTPFAPEPPWSANTPRIRPPMSAVESVPFSQAKPAQPMFIPGAGEITDPRMQEFAKPLLKGPVSPEFAKNILGILAPKAQASVKDRTQDALFHAYLKNGNLEGLEVLGETREKFKAEKDEAKKLGDILEAAGGVKDGPQWKKAFGALADKIATHPQPPSTTVNVGQEKAEAATVGKGYGEMFMTVQQDAVKSQASLNKYARMQQLLTNIQTGKLKPLTKEVSALGESLGFQVDPTLPAQQAFDALEKSMALEMRNPSGGAGMPGAMSDQDRSYLEKTVPGLANTKGGNALIIDAAKKMAQRSIDVAKMAREYRKKNGGINEGFFDELQTWAEKHPLFEFLEIRTTKDGRTLGKKADGTIVEIK